MLFILSTSFYEFKVNKYQDAFANSTDSPTTFAPQPVRTTLMYIVAASSKYCIGTRTKNLSVAGAFCLSAVIMQATYYKPALPIINRITRYILKPKYFKNIHCACPLRKIMANVFYRPNVLDFV